MRLVCLSRGACLGQHNTDDEREMTTIMKKKRRKKIEKVPHEKSIAPQLHVSVLRLGYNYHMVAVVATTVENRNCCCCGNFPHVCDVSVAVVLCFGELCA